MLSAGPLLPTLTCPPARPHTRPPARLSSRAPAPARLSDRPRVHPTALGFYDQEPNHSPCGGILLWAVGSSGMVGCATKGTSTEGRLSAKGTSMEGRFMLKTGLAWREVDDDFRTRSSSSSSNESSPSSWLSSKSWLSSAKASSTAACASSMAVWVSAMSRPEPGLFETSSISGIFKFKCRQKQKYGSAETSEL